MLSKFKQLLRFTTPVRGDIQDGYASDEVRERAKRLFETEGHTPNAHEIRKLRDLQVYEMAQQGDANAQYEWGLSNMLGEIAGKRGKPDYTEATIWLERAAHQGRMDAWGMLAGLYEGTIKSIPKDLPKALEYWKKAEAAGDKNAHLSIELISKRLNQK